MGENQALNRFKELLAGEPPELGPGPRAGVMSVAALDNKLAQLFTDHKLRAQSRDLIRGLVLLWHDHHEPAHELAQAIDNADGSLLHGILHRREPDYGNAAYWFRRVGQHPCFPAIAQRVTELAATQKQNTLPAQLIRNGEWDAFAFIKACEEASDLKSSDPRVSLLRQIQAIESHALLEHLVGA
jgi:hypothetical protein